MALSRIVTATERGQDAPATERSHETLYLSGPMSGVPYYNFPAFEEAAADLRSRGFSVISPAELDEERGMEPDPDGTPLPEDEYLNVLAQDKEELEECDGVVCLPGWHESRGAREEIRHARSLGMPVYRYSKSDPLPPLELVPLYFGPVKSADYAYHVPEHGTGEERITDPDTGGQKGRKPQRFELMPWNALGEIAEVYAYGAQKYDDHNWRKGYAWSLSFGALMRHLALFWEGENLDMESGLPHLAHAGFHILTLLTFIEDQLGKDDRP